MSFLTQPLTNTKQGSTSESNSQFEVSREQSVVVDLIVQPKTKWEKILYQLNYSHEKQQLNYQTQPVGFNLYKWLLHQQLLEKLPLYLNLPETLVKDQNDVTFMLHTHGGRLLKRKATVMEFDAHIQNAIQSTLSSDKAKQYLLKSQPSLDFKSNPYIPYLMERVPNLGKEHQTLFDKEIITYKSTTEVKYKASRGKLLQRFIYSRNLKAMLLRLCYHSRSSSDKNYMHRAQNFSNLLRWNSRTQAYESSPQLAFVLIDKDCPDRFQFSVIRGKALLPYEKMAASLTNFLERAMSIRIGKLYLDFMLSVEGVPYFTNIKWIQLLPSCRLELDCSSLTCTVYCKLCGGSFRKDEVTKTLTYKLLFELVEHLKKRTRKQDQSSKLLHQLSFNENVNKPCQLCNVCYMLVVSEHELIQVERELAKLVNIPINEEQVINSNNKPRNRPAYLPSHLYQWRILLYFSEVAQLDLTTPSDKVYLQYKFGGLHSFSESFRLGTLGSSSHHVNKLRMHYFFSQSLNIDKFLLEGDIKIRLTNGNDWNQVLAEGSSCTISHFKNKAVLDCGQRHSSSILLFYESCRYCQLSLSVGLVLDGSYNTLDLNLYKQKDVYVTDSSYHNSNQLPKEWMEMYSLNYDVDVNKEIDYTPLCTEQQIRNMIGIRYIRKDLAS